MLGCVVMDLSFLDVPLGRASSRPKPVNVYDILREGWRETRVDMTLQFFLDPNERHGLGTIVIDALLGVLEGAPLIGASGKTSQVLVAADYLGSDAWEISTQSEYVDVLATNLDLGLAIVLENKIGHELNNPLNRYAEHALGGEGVDSVVVVVLAPERRSATAAQERWLSRSITYAELADAIRRAPGLIDRALSPIDLDQRRSLDLLQQFFEARTGAADVSDLEAEGARVDEWRELMEHHGDAVQNFLAARSTVIRVLRARNRRLEPLISDGLKAAGLSYEWESHGGSKTEAWNAYHFPDVDWSVELKLSSDPENPPIFVFDYRGRTYQQSSIESLGLDWNATDEGIAAMFIARVTTILGQVRAGTR